MFIKLKFINYTAERTDKLEVSVEDVDFILTLYGSHYAGDQYEVFGNDEQIAIDQNGQRENKVIDEVAGTISLEPLASIEL